jgi:hypothetical protein
MWLEIAVWFENKSNGDIAQNQLITEFGMGCHDIR